MKINNLLFLREKTETEVYAIEYFIQTMKDKYGDEIYIQIGYEYTSSVVGFSNSIIVGQVCKIIQAHGGDYPSDILETWDVVQEYKHVERDNKLKDLGI